MDDFSSLNLIKATDVFMVPVCLIILLVLAYVFRQKYRNTIMVKFFMPALLLRFLFAFIYALVIEYYYGFGDTSLYYQAIADMRIAINNEPSMVSEIYGSLKLDALSPLYNYFVFDNGHFTNLYMQNISNYFVPRFALPFSFLFYNSYLCICFCLSFYSFAGCWRIFKLFVQMYPHLRKKIAISILYLPSVLFWGGSLLKDSICLGSLGFALYAIHSIFFKKKKIFASSVILFLTGFLLFYIKPYILLCLIPSIFLWLFLQFKNQIEDKTLRNISAFLFTILSIVAGFFALQAVTQSELTNQYSSDKILQTVQGTQESFAGGSGNGSSFAVGSVGSSAFGLVALFPLGLVATLFRPFIWESGSPLMATSAIEAFGFLILTLMALRRLGIKRFFSLAVSDSVIVFCLVFSLLFAGIVGVTTTNFGALVRYKIPCIPFYLMTLFLIMDKSGKFSPDIVFSKKFF